MHARNRCTRGSRSLPRAGADRARSAALRRFILPVAVSADPVRAIRVGSTQSNMSMPRCDHAENALGVTEAHEVAGLLGRQERRRPADRLEHLGPALPHGQARRARCRRTRARRSPRSSGAAAPGRFLPARSRTAAAPAPGVRRSAARPRAACAAPHPRARPRDESAGGQMSRHIAMSEPSRRWISATLSGVNRSGAPS